MANRQSIRLTAGEDRTITLTATNPDGSAMDLTGASINWTLARLKGNAPSLVKSGTILSAAAGTFTISITADDTRLLRAATYFHQALITISGSTKNGVEGNAVVTAENQTVLAASTGISYDGTQFYSSEVQAAQAKINGSVTFVWTAGLNTPGDGQGQLYKRSGSQPSHANYFQSADGAYWESVTWGNISGYRGPLTDKHGGSYAWKFADRLFVGAAAQSDGSSAGTGGHTFLGDTSKLNSYWAERNATVLGVSNYGGGGGVFASRASDQYTYLGVSIVWASGQSVATGDKRGYQQKIYTAASSGTTGATPPTHTSGTVSDGAVNWTFTESTYMTPIGMTAMAMNDVLDGNATWAAYFEVQRASGAGKCYALEIDTKNKGSDVAPDAYNYLPTGSTVGIWLAGGGDSSLGAPANPSSAAITIGKNGTTWNRGIVFQSDGLTADGSGYMEAINLGQKQLIKWYVSAGNAGANIRSEVSNAGQACQLIFNNDAFTFVTRSAQSFGIFNASGGNPVNFLRADSVATGNAAILNATGSDTDVDLKLNPKGAGVVQFGTNTAKGAEAFASYITIKDSGGTLRKVMVCA